MSTTKPTPPSKFALPSSSTSPSPPIQVKSEPSSYETNRQSNLENKATQSFDRAEEQSVKLEEARAADEGQKMQQMENQPEGRGGLEDRLRFQLAQGKAVGDTEKREKVLTRPDTPTLAEGQKKGSPTGEEAVKEMERIIGERDEAVKQKVTAAQERDKAKADVIKLRDAAALVVERLRRSGATPANTADLEADTPWYHVPA